MKPAVFHREAEAELQAAVAWYEGQLSPGSAWTFRPRWKKRSQRFNRSGQGIRGTKVKIRANAASNRFPYTVYFLELDDIIWIAAVAHHKRRPDYWAARDPAD